MASLPNTILEGAFAVRTVGSRRVDDQLVVTVEARPRWWSWRYWLHRIRMLRAEWVEAEVGPRPSDTVPPPPPRQPDPAAKGYIEQANQ